MWYRMGATVFVQPLDLVKNRMQLSGKQKYYVTVGTSTIIVIIL